LADRHVLAIDVGSSGVRSLLSDLQGHTVSFVWQELSSDTPEEVAPFGRQFDPAALWDAVCQTVRQTIAEAAVPADSIAAVSAASLRLGVVFLDRDGEELYIGPNNDVRALVEGLNIDGECGPDVCRITGHMPSFLFTPARLRWFQVNRPEVYQRIATVFSINDWIVYRLCGERVGEVSSSCDMGLVDVSQTDWSAELFEMLDLPRDVYPQQVSAGTRIGAVTASAAEQTGLAAGTTVVAGGADTQSGLLGMGVKNSGQVGIVAGWSAPVQMVTERPMVDLKGRLWSCCHILPGKWVLESNAGETGRIYRWMYGITCDKAEDKGLYASLDRMAEDVYPGAGGMLAFLGPKVMDMSHLGPFLGGFIFTITTSVTNIERKHLVRAALENLCFAFKANCDRLREVSRLEVKDISIGGGLAQSRLLMQMLSDTLAMPVAVFDVAQVSAIGTAMCAATGVGVYKSLEQAMEAMRPQPAIVEPDRQRSRDYDDWYARWRTTYKWLEELNEKWYQQVEP
jgi:sugar (pentulose or hexulose) kinase